MRRFLSTFMIAAALSAPQLSAQKEVGWETDQFLPELELPTIDGKQTIRLSDFKGERILLIQFASW